MEVFSVPFYKNLQQIYGRLNPIAASFFPCKELLSRSECLRVLCFRGYTLFSASFQGKPIVRRFGKVLIK